MITSSRGASVVSGIPRADISRMAVIPRHRIRRIIFRLLRLLHTHRHIFRLLRLLHLRRHIFHLRRLISHLHYLFLQVADSFRIHCFLRVVLSRLFFLLWVADLRRTFLLWVVDLRRIFLLSVVDHQFLADHFRVHLRCTVRPQCLVSVDVLSNSHSLRAYFFVLRHIDLPQSERSNFARRGATRKNMSEIEQRILRTWFAYRRDHGTHSVAQPSIISVIFAINC